MFTTAGIARPLLRAAVSSVRRLRAARRTRAAPRKGPTDVRARSTSRRRRRSSATPPTPSSASSTPSARAAGSSRCAATATSRRPRAGIRRDMARRNYFSHVTPGGEDLGDRLRDAGYGDPGDGWRAGENLGWGTGNRATPNSLVDEWLASPAHKGNMLERSFRELGVGVAGGAPQATDGAPARRHVHAEPGRHPLG